jgi:hypothetical protein
MSKHSPQQVRYIADTLMPNFIPKDTTIDDLSFVFTADGENYEVIYKKDKSGDWQFISQQKAIK